MTTASSRIGTGHSRGWASPALLIATLLPFTAGAVDLAEGNPDWSVRWDNTVKLSTLYRLKDADPALNDSFRLLVPGVPASAFPQALNFNAGNQNFQKKGFVSQRFDFFSEFDAVYQSRMGLRLSAVGWYDHAYHRATDANNDPTIAQVPYNRVPARTRRLAGQDAEVFDAFVFGKWTVAEGRELTLRLGQHALQYGESLFFGDNAVARAQGPLDAQKALSSPNAQFKEIIRPVPQLSMQLQLAPKISVGGYYQFRWASDRLPPAGSYFSNNNIPWGSSQPEFIGIPAGPLAGNYLLAAGGDRHARNSGQFGLQLKASIAETDLGLYFARFHDKDGQLYGKLNVVSPLAGTGAWNYVFPEDIKVLGASASRSVGDFNFAGEASVRDNMPLRSTNMVYPVGLAPQPRPALGRTAHLNFSWLASLGPNFIAKEASFLGEIAWNRVLRKDDPDNQLDTGRTRSSTILRLIYSPTYRQVLPGLDLSVPLGIGYTLQGNSSVTPAWGAKDTGDLSIGLEGTYLDTWRFALAYQHYIGKAVPGADYSPALTGGTPILGLGNSLKDRDYLSLSLRRTF